MLGFGRPNFERVLALYGPHGKVIGAKIRAFQRALGWTDKVTARELGIRVSAYQKACVGMVCASPELQRRVIRVFFNGESWAKTPTKPAVPFRAKTKRKMWIRWFDEQLYEKLVRFALAHNYSMSAVVVAAVERFMLEEPALVTIKAALDIAERMRTESILAANPDLVYILQGDPVVVQLSKQAERIEAQYETELNSWKPIWDGPADPAVTNSWVESSDEP